MAISVRVPDPPPMAMITSQDKTSVNSRPPPISKPQGIRTVGLNSPHIFLLFVPVIPTVIPLFFDASIAAFVDREEYSFSAPYTNILFDLAIRRPSSLANSSAYFE